MQISLPLLYGPILKKKKKNKPLEGTLIWTSEFLKLLLLRNQLNKSRDSFRGGFLKCIAFHDGGEEAGCQRPTAFPQMIRPWAQDNQLQDIHLDLEALPGLGQQACSCL